MFFNIIKTYLALLIIFNTNIAYSQIVNIEKNRKTTKNGFQGTADFELSAKNTGNKIFELKNNIDLQYTKKNKTVIFINNIKYLKLDTGSLINDGFVHFRFNTNLTDSGFFIPESFFQVQYNANKLLKERIITGLGPRFKIIDKQSIKIYTAALTMYEYEMLSDTQKTVTEKWRLDYYINSYFTVNKTFSFNYITYYQPAFSNFADYRMSGELGMRLTITKNFATNMSYSVDYDSQPPPNVQKMFYSFNTKFVFMF